MDEPKKPTEPIGGPLTGQAACDHAIEFLRQVAHGELTFDVPAFVSDQIGPKEDERWTVTDSSVSLETPDLRFPDFKVPGA